MMMPLNVEAVDSIVECKSLCGCIDFQSVHVSYNKRLVGHKILSPRDFPLYGTICSACTEEKDS